MSDPVKVRADLQNILSRDEFQLGKGKATNPLTQFVDSAKQYWKDFREWFDSLFSFAGHLGAVGKALVYVIVALLLLGGALVIAKILRNYFQNKTLAAVGARTVFDEEDPEDEISHDAQTWLHQADGLAQANDWKRAYRAVFVAALMHFEAADILAFARGRTNGEYWQAVRSSTPKPVSDTFRTFVLGFDSRWYGNAATTEADYKESLALYERIQKGLAAAQSAASSAPTAQPIAEGI